MKKTIERNTISWALLISLTLLTTFFIHTKYAVFPIIIIAFIKLALVALQFMEMKNAHRILKVLFLFFLWVLLGTIGLLL